jgi:hypothetical protein
MRRFRVFIVLAIVGFGAFSAGRVSAGAPAPPWTFVKDPDGVSWLVINDELIGIPYYPVPDDQWNQFHKSGLWAIPKGEGIGYGPCPSWYAHVCDPLRDIRVPIDDLPVLAEDSETPPDQPPGVILERVSTATPTPNPPSGSNITRSIAGFDPGKFLGSNDKFDCNDFASQAQAQAVLRADPKDPNHLDPNKDGIACQGRPEPTDFNKVPR